MSSFSIFLLLVVKEFCSFSGCFIQSDISLTLHGKIQQAMQK